MRSTFSSLSHHTSNLLWTTRLPSVINTMSSANSIRCRALSSVSGVNAPVTSKKSFTFGMNKPAVYGNWNDFPTGVNLKCLQDNVHRMKWKKMGDTAIDFGCADGRSSVLTKDFKPYADHYYKTYIASDVNEDMVKFAKEKYGQEHNNMSFRVLDMEGNIPAELIGTFNHVFSFFVLHFVQNQEKAFKNVYDLMDEGGDTLINFIVNTPVFTNFKILSRLPKWKSMMKRVDEFVSPYNEMKNPDIKVADIMKRIGFKNIDVQFKTFPYVFHHEELKNIIRGVEPFRMSDELFEEFMTDYFACEKEFGVRRYKINEEEQETYNYDFEMIVIYATK